MLTIECSKPQQHSIQEDHRFQSSPAFRLVGALERSAFGVSQIVFYTESQNSLGNLGRLQEMKGKSLHLENYWL